MWLRHIIQPPAGYALVYSDYVSQEIGVVAALSDDRELQRTYQAADIYMDFAVHAGLAPIGAIRAEYEGVRETCKALFLGVNYGMGDLRLSREIGKSLGEARAILSAHCRLYSRFWEWADAAVNFALTRGRIHTVFGWQLHRGPKVKVLTLRNFVAQANGAEVLRLATIMLNDAGFQICGLIHDAVLLMMPLEEVDRRLPEAEELMRQASGKVLRGFQLRVESKVVRYPDHYRDKRGAAGWKIVEEAIGPRPWTVGGTPAVDGRGIPAVDGRSVVCS